VILEEILARTRADLVTRRQAHPLASLEAAARSAPPPRSLSAALRRSPAAAGARGAKAMAVGVGVGVAIIAEFKRRSPSAGWIREGAEVEEIARAYSGAGAAALSILTDEPFFGGSLEDLRRARAAVALPILRKDFLVDPYQVVEARAAGADAVLLICSALTDDEITNLLTTARAWGLEVLTEAHDQEEVARAVRLGAEIIGVNNRDLKTFTMDRDLAIRLRPSIPDDRVVVAESGIRGAEDMARLERAGIHAALVGETLMRAADPGGALRELLS
jgi:indole-3-glycerol phosphate synthase